MNRQAVFPPIQVDKIIAKSHFDPSFLGSPLPPDAVRRRIYEIFAKHSPIDRELAVKLLTEARYLRAEVTVMVIRYSDGSYIEGAIHRLEGTTMRAGVAGIDDAVEYTLIRDKWISETGLVVTFEFPLEKGMGLFRVMPGTIERESACATGGDCVLRRTAGACAGAVN